MTNNVVRTPAALGLAIDGGSAMLAAQGQGSAAAQVHIEAGRARQPAPSSDRVVTDGMKLTLGHTTRTMYLTPGHTLRTISTLIRVKDKGQTHLAAWSRAPAVSPRHRCAERWPVILRSTP